MTAEPLALSTLDELQRDGVLQRWGDRYETTRRWRAARHRASVAAEPGSDRVDLRNPILQALLLFYGGHHPRLETLSPHLGILLALETSERVVSSTQRRR